MHDTSILLVLTATALGLAPGTIAAQAVAPPNFAEHIAPLVFAHCSSCHRPGQAAPFSLLSFADVRRRGKTIARVVAARDMPPWHPVAGHGSFAGESRLSDEEIASVLAWVEGGMPEGDPAATPPPPSFASGWQLREPDLVVAMPVAYEVPAGGPDIYRNFVVPLGLAEDRWLTAIDVRPSARTVLHHIIFSFDTSGRARALDGRDGQPGFAGMGGEGGGLNGTAAVGGWAVGGQARELPMGLARRVPKGADLVLRSHFHPSGKVENEQTTLALYFAKEPPTRSMVGLQLPPAFGVAAGLDVPAGEREFKIADSFVLPVDALGVEVGGHAHYICKDMHVWATSPGGERSSVFWIDDWDFNWQNRYQYREPIEFAKGTRIDVAITYDNSAENPRNPHDPPRRVRWGLQSTDEMGSVTLLLVPRVEADAQTLQRAVQQHSREHLAGAARNGGAAGAMLSRVMMLDKNGDGRLEASEVPEQLRRLVERFDTDRDGVVDETELETALRDAAGGARRRRDD